MKLDGLSGFTYTRLSRRSRRRGRPACTLLSLGLSNARQGYLVEAEENRRSSSHPRTDDVTHQLSLRLRRQRADRPFLSLFSLFSAASDCYAPDARACTCVRVRTVLPQSACMRALIGGHNSRRRPIRIFGTFPSFFGQSVPLALSLTCIVRVRIHFIYDATSSLFVVRVFLNLYRGPFKFL